MKVYVGEEIEFDGRRFRVVAVSGASVTLRDQEGGAVREVAIEELTRSETFRALAPPMGTSVGVDLADLQYLDGARMTEVRFWVDCLEQLEGALSLAEAAGMPRGPVFEEAAARLRALGRPVDVRTLQRKRAGFREHGAAALIDRRLSARSTRPNRRIDERIIAAVAEVMEAQVNESTGTRTRIVERTRRLLDERFGAVAVPLPSRATMFRLIAEMDRGRFVTGSARTRRSLSNRPDRPFQAMGASRPGEQVQIDSTKLDLFVQLPDGTRARPEVTIMLDVATRSVISAVVRPVATKSIDLVVLLARALVPYERRPSGRAETRALVSGSLEAPLLGEDELAEHRQRVPYIFPDTITTDHGRIFVSEHFRAACQRLGISLNLAAKYTPTDKAKVERMFQSINTGFAQYLSGYTGRGVEYRGEAPDAGVLLSLPQLQELLDEWITFEWQNRQHDSLRDPLFPSVSLTPNEMARAYRQIVPELAVPFDEETYLSLMPVAWRTIQQYGITIDNRTYDSAALGPLRRMKSPHAAQGGKWPIHHDPYNVQTVWLFVDDRWLPLQWVNAHVTGPMSGDVWAMTRKPGFLYREPAAEARRVEYVRDILSRGANPDRKQARVLARSVAVETDQMRLSEPSSTEKPPLPEPERVASVTRITPARFGLMDEDTDWDSL